MTPVNCLNALLQTFGRIPLPSSEPQTYSDNKNVVINTIQSVTGSSVTPLVGSSGLSMQYAIMMGLIEDALRRHPGQSIQFMVPPNCYGGTNDQARRVAACLPQVEIMDLPVDGDHDMVQSIDRVLEKVAELDAIPYIIAEIPTNPRVEVPDLVALNEVLSKRRLTPAGTPAIDPVFILDQTFCPNVQFLGDDQLLASVRTISYVSGSKFPSGGKCTAGYCVSNQRAAALMPMIEKHLEICDNEATAQQVAFLAEQLPSMNDRIHSAYLNTHDFVRFIQSNLPAAKINFVSDELAEQGFTPSVFSLDLPTKGETPEAREAHKRELNLRLIQMMIDRIPHESKYCVSYGQLKGCYWTIPATSTQGTTREGDKDYIVRVAVSHDMDLELHKTVFLDFVQSMD
jgi:cystathionine beta-lyase/cystathionine gamma-synthase